MSAQLLAALVTYAFATTVTPGPNNAMQMASGANYGFLRTVPHMLGVTLGFGAMVFLVGVGLLGVFEAAPHSMRALQIIGALYLLYLAWKTATASGLGSAQARGRPMSFLAAAAFQWVNPKAWSMALAATAIYAPDRSMLGVALVALVFTIVNVPAACLWTLAGTQIRRLLTDPRRLRLFNLVMAGLLVVSLYPVLMS